MQNSYNNVLSFIFDSIFLFISLIFYQQSLLTPLSLWRQSESAPAQTRRSLWPFIKATPAICDAFEQFSAKRGILSSGKSFFAITPASVHVQTAVIYSLVEDYVHQYVCPTMQQLFVRLLWASFQQPHYALS